MRPFYYVRTQEKCEISLVDLFNSIRINKYKDLSRTEFTKTLRAPIIIHSDKNFANWYRNNDHKKRPLPLPIGGLRYVSKAPNTLNRTQSTYCRNIFSKASDKWLQDIQPTPYYLYYELEYLMDNKSAFGQITENIVPYFNPYRTLRIKEFDFAPDIERKIPVYLENTEDIFEDEIEIGPNHKYIRTKFKFRLDVDWYRPFELPEIIKYSELNYEVGQFIHKQQVLIYPDSIAESQRKKWETLDDSTKTGYSLLKSCAGTLLKKIDTNGAVTWEDITAPDAKRPVAVPNFDLLNLDFETDTAIATDDSGFGRDFVALNDSTRQFVSDVDGNGDSGQIVEDGYKVDDSVSWNKILDWFGTNNGLNENPFTFEITLQFTDSTPPDTIFQYLTNDATTDSSGNLIPEGEVFFDWGIMDSKLYFSFQTYGNDSLSYTFTTEDKLILNNTNIYKFIFVIYEQGHSGLFGYSINGGDTIVLDTKRE